MVTVKATPWRLIVLLVTVAARGGGTGARQPPKNPPEILRIWIFVRIVHFLNEDLECYTNFLGEKHSCAQAFPYKFPYTSEGILDRW